MLVQPLRVNNAADGHIHIGRADAVQHLAGITALHHEFSHGRLVKQGHAISHRLAFGGCFGKPVGVAKTVLIAWGRARRVIPVGALPAAELTHAGTLRDQPVMKGRASGPASGFKLPKRPMHGVQ